MKTTTKNFTLSRRNLIRAAVMGTALLATGTSLAENFPTKPIRLVIPAPPGGGTDTMARLMAKAVTESANWTFIPDNRPGGGGNIGFDQAFKAQPDGYTLALGESSNMIVNQFLYHQIPFDIEKDMQPIALLARVPLVLIVSASGPYTSVDELLAAGKNKSLSFASSGNGTLAHLVGESWKHKLGTDMLHVPYRGAAPAMTDLVGGRVDMFFASIPAALPMIQAGKVRALAITAADRVAVLKNVPTMEEAGYKDMEASVVFGLVGPAGIPSTIISQINTQVNKAMQNPEMVKQLGDMGVERTSGSVGDDANTFAKLLSEERSKWEPVVKASGATVD